MDGGWLRLSTRPVGRFRTLVPADEVDALTAAIVAVIEDSAQRPVLQDAVLRTDRPAST